MTSGGAAASGDGGAVLRRWRGTGERKRLAVAVVGLLLVYVAIVALGDARAHSGSDAGGKSATVKVMTERSSWSPDVGYWAAAHDPEGRHHPLLYTRRSGDQWIQATTLPMLYAAVPLWHLGGPTAVLLLPVLGGLLTAYAARRLARTLTATDGGAAFWMVGLASPVLFYAGDFWEHGPAVGLALMAVAVALEPGGWPKAAVTGVLAGVAVSLRAEMALYGIGLAVAVVLLASERPRLLRPARVAAVVGGAGGTVAATVLLERFAISRAVVGGTGVREERLGAQITDLGMEAPARLGDAVLTTVGLFPTSRTPELVAGVLVVVAVAVVGWWASRGSSMPPPPGVVVAGVVAVALYAARLADGPGFVPGFLVAAPLSVVGLVAATGRSRVLLVGALAALPPIWLLQWRGQLLAQWGGRLTLLSAVLLVVAGVIALERAGWRRPGSVALVLLAVVVSGFGAVWHVQRTSAVGRAVDAIEAAPPDVVVVTAIPHLGREAGAWYGDRRWLRANTVADLESAVGVAASAGVGRIDVVEHPDRAGQPEAVSAAGWREVSERTVTYVRGIPLTVRRYERVSG